MFLQIFQKRIEINFFLKFWRKKKDEYGRLGPDWLWEAKKQFLSEEVDGRNPTNSLPGLDVKLLRSWATNYQILRPDLDESGDFENSENIYYWNNLES